MASINDLLNQTASVIEGNTEIDDFLKNAQDEWKYNYDVGETVPEFSIDAYINNAMNKDLDTLSETELQALIMQYELPSDTGFDNVAERINDLRRGWPEKENELRTAIDQVQNDPAIAKEFFQAGSERKQRQALAEEQRIREGKPDPAVEEAKRRKEKEAVTKINKGDKKLEDIIADPSLLEKEKTHRQRRVADRAYQHSLYGAQFAGDGNMPKFLNNVSELSLADNDFLFRIDASDDIIEDVYNTVIKDTDWQDDYIRRRYDTGEYSKKFDFKAKKAKDLNDGQWELLKEDFESNELKKFKDSFETVTQRDVVSPGPFGRPITTQEEIRSFSATGARRNYMKREVFGGVDPTTKEFSDAIDKAIENVPNGATTGRQVDALMAYRDYAKKSYENANTTKVMKAKEFMTENFGKADAQAAHKLLKNELKGLGHDGIKASSKLRGLKVAGGIAAGAIALWAAGEIWDE
jgi:hypothetical protein